MDVTALARSLLEPIPAHRTAGLEVLRAADSTVADITDEAHALVCRGTFEWSVRRP